MIWRKDKPETMGEYIILLPTFFSPQDPNTERPGCICSVYKATFDGNLFSYRDITGLTQSWDGYAEVGQCIWTPMPKVFAENGCGFAWTEQDGSIGNATL